MTMQIIKCRLYRKLTCNHPRMWKRRQTVTICLSTRMIVIDVVEENCYSKVNNNLHNWRFPSLVSLLPLFVGTMNECEEFCHGDRTLLIDDSTWLNYAPQANEQSTEKSTNASRTQGKRNKQLVQRKPSQKRLRISEDGHVSVDHQIEDSATNSSNRRINGSPSPSNAANIAASRNHRNNDPPVSSETTVMLDLTNVSCAPRNTSVSSTHEANRVITAGTVVQQSSAKTSEVSNGRIRTSYHLSL